MNLRLLRDDYARHGRSLKNPAFIALATYRLGRWAFGCEHPVGRWFAIKLYNFINFFVANITKVWMPPKVTIGEGFHIIHADGCLSIHPDVVIGDRLGVMHNVTIGTNMGEGVPRIGDDVFIGVNSTVLGPITIGDRVRIAANTAVTTNVPSDSIVVGSPGKIFPRLAPFAPEMKPGSLSVRDLPGWNETRVDYDRTHCVHQQFEAQVARTPQATALVFEAETLSYADLDARANQVAHVLRGLGVGPDHLVGLAMPRSLDLVVAAIAIHKAGGAYVPIDPAYPADRIALYIADSEATVILTRSDISSVLPPHGAQTLLIDLDPRIAAAPTTTPPTDVAPNHLAYVIYTSGSTGRPKGVMVEHCNVSNFFTGMDARIGTRPGVWLAVTSLSFDISVLELFWTLTRGFKVVLASEGNRAMVAAGRVTGGDVAFADDDFSPAAQILRHGVTHLQCTPSMIRMFLFLNDDMRFALGTVGTLLLGGEPLPGNLVGEIAKATSARVENMYGPTETTVWSSTARANAGESVANIGTPIANTQFHVLDENGAEVPIGTAGELYIGGDGVTRGYLRRPDLTAERFPPDRAGSAGARLYRTGDLVRVRPDGALDFIGRADHQVKILGHRIELGEIEARLEEIEDIRQAVVVARDVSPGDTRLIAYLTVIRPVEDVFLRRRLAEHLPDFMIPAYFMTLDAFPLTPNRKVDRNALPAPNNWNAASARQVDDSRARIIAYLRQALGAMSEPEPDQRLFSSGALDSVAMFNLIAFVEEAAGLHVKPEDVTLANFDTPDRILRFVAHHH